MMDFDRIIASAPVNRTAAIVATGSHEPDTLTNQQLRENLLGFIASLEKSIASAKDSAVKKRLGLRKLQVQNALKALKPPAPPKRERVIADIFMDVAREQLPKALFNLILRQARTREAAMLTNGANDA